jgi:hypothetical protein
LAAFRADVAAAFLAGEESGRIRGTNLIVAGTWGGFFRQDET